MYLCSVWKNLGGLSMTNYFETTQNLLEKERKKKELNSALVNAIDIAIKTKNFSQLNVSDVMVEFSINHIPENLREFFKEQSRFLWGELSNNAPLEKKKYFYPKAIFLDGDIVTVKLIKNW